VALDKGTTLAGYEITGILGQGGMGVVYEATQLSLNRTVALKVLAPHLGDDILFRERFKREGQIQAGIDHPNIVTVYDTGETEHGFFIAMRLIRGPNLKDMIVARELDPGRTLRILSPISQALDTAHEAGLIHRDIKPQNILVGRRDQAFLADFGLTKASGDRSLTRTGQFVGTFDYISPEQIKGERATTKSDVYALAAVLYECLTGIVPFPKDSEAAVLYAQMSDPPPKVTDHRPELPGTLDAVIARGMAKDPTERYGSAGELLHETHRGFTRRMRAAFTPPRPIEAPQETGIRDAEVEVPTREAPAADGEPPTEEGALEADTVSPGGPDLTVPSAAAPPETQEAPPAEPAETAPTEAPPPETAPGETIIGASPPAAAADTAPAETAPGETARAEAAAEPDVTRVGDAGPEVTRPGEDAPDTRPGETPPGVTRAGETPVTAILPDADVTRPGKVEPGPTRLGEAAAASAGAAGATVGASRAAAGAGAPPSARPRPTRRAGLQPPVAIAAGLVLLVAVVAGFLIGHSGGGDSDPAKPAANNSQSAGGLDLSFPDDWRRGTPADIPGLDLSSGGGQIAVTRQGSPKADTLSAGITDATGPALLPASFLDRLSQPPPRNDAVKLGDIDMYRYKGLQPKGYSGSLTLYVAPTTEGVATIACAATTASAATFLPACESVADGISLTNGNTFPLGADQDYLDKLNGTIDDLNAAVKKDAASLRKAKKRAGQADAARALASDYGKANKSLAGLDVSPAVADGAGAVRRALAQTEAAYKDLASAASKGKSKAYSAASKQVAAGQKALQNALEQVDAAS
jgi:hypothetical protein